MISRFSVLLVICATLCGSSVGEVQNYRLPLTTIPVHYTLSLAVDPEPSNTFFHGRVSILSEVNSITSSIVLHQYDLNITSISVIGQGENDGVEYYSSHEAEDDTHFLTIQLREQLQPTEYVLIGITYTGPYYGPSTSLFRDVYKDEQGNNRYLLATHMEPIKARGMFPCYDEPGFRATFEIRVVCPSEYHVLSNTPTYSVVPLPGISDTLYMFEVTPPMPTYLVALVVSDFDYLSNTKEGETQSFPKEFRSYARPGVKELLEYSVDVGQKLLQILEDYVDLKYDMKKMDNIAVPSFGGAMENWGIVIYGERTLIELRDEDGDITNKDDIAEIMAHEFAHMWFGNEITPVWWEYLWLSEGFATYFQYYALSVLEPSWMTMYSFVFSSVHSSLYADSFPNTRPMNIPDLGSPQSLQGIFNFIPYGKSASVIRMMSHILGEDVFQQSIRRYIAAVSRGNTMPEYLYEAMQASIGDKELLEGTDVADVMGSWTSQAGYPLITVTRNGDSDSFIITQRRYYRTPEITSDELWWVPLNWATEIAQDYSDTSPSEIMPPVPQVTLQIQDSQPYVVLNKQQTGYYRIMYDAQNWIALAKVLIKNPDKIHTLNKAQIVDDAMEFCDVGLMPCNFTMNLLQYLANETELHPWRVAERKFNRLFVLMRDSQEYTRLQKMAFRLNNKRLRTLGLQNMKNEDSMVRENRESSIAVACSAAPQECSLRGARYVRTTRQSNHIRGEELCATLRGLPQAKILETWSDLWEEFITSHYTARRVEIKKALPCISDDATVKVFIQRVLEDKINGDEMISLLQGLAHSSPSGVGAILNLLKTHYNILKQRSPVRNELADIIRTLGEHITTQEYSLMLGELASMWRDHRALSVAENEAIQVAQEAASVNIRWQTNQRLQLEYWLRTNVQ